MKQRIFYIAVLAITVLSLIYSERVIIYVRESLTICADIIIPTLFPFFVLSGLLIYSGFGSALAKAAQGFMRPLFNVPPAGAAAFALGIISGFPLGAVTAAELYRCGSLSKSEAERLLAFSNNSGPLFIIGSVGAAIYGRPALGVALYIIHIISSIFVGMIFSQYGKSKHDSPPMRLLTNEMPISEAVAAALKNAAKNIITVCFSIIFFAAVSRMMLDLAPFPPAVHAILSGICEFSTGVINISSLNLGLYEKLVLTSFIIGFSGLCVHIQVMAVTCGAGLSLKPYIFGKLLHGAIAGAITAALLKLLPRTVAVFSGCSSPISASCAVIPLMLAAEVVVIMLISLIQKAWATTISSRPPLSKQKM